MRKSVLTFLMFLASYNLIAQSYIGFLSDNYSGVHGVISNPANITDSRFKTDINLVGASVFASNDFYELNFNDAIKDENYSFDLDARSNPTTNNNGSVAIDVLGPSFMFNLNKVSSIAVFSRARAFTNVNEIDGTIVDRLDADASEDFNVNEGDFKVFGQSWAEIGLTYARVIKNDAQHFLKGGVTFKYLKGLGSGYANGKNLTVDYDADGTDLGGGVTTGSITSTGQITYARFDDFDKDGYDYEVPDASGFGADLGFVYEWRPKYSEYTKTNANGESYTLKHKNKYKLKLGLSLTDLGSINYKNGISETYDVTNANVSEEDIENAESIDDVLEALYTKTAASTGYKTILPTALHFNADWSFTNHLYLNLNTDLSLASKKKENVSTINNVLSLTPRFESRWFSFYIPLSMVQYNGFQAGAGLRLGPLYVGSGSVITALAGNESRGADAYAGLKIPIYQGKARDKDGDGIIDKLDKCPKEAGPEENNGCPWGDKDQDGILDNEDNCPEEAGPAENKGCPWGDTDADGILDNEDDCVLIAGPAENKGCPWKDSDGDSVVDKDDQCVDVPGTVANNGCPEPEPEPEVTVEVQKTLNDYAKTILFNSGKSSIKTESYTVLNDIVAILKEYPSAKFSIEGHTDSAGSETLNQRLSESRASTVMTFLIENGIESKRLNAVGYGESKPIANNATASGRAANRRVEINLVK